MPPNEFIETESSFDMLSVRKTCRKYIYTRIYIYFPATHFSLHLQSGLNVSAHIFYLLVHVYLNTLVVKTDFVENTGRWEDNIKMVIK
jgi:hypothetical protein